MVKEVPADPQSAAEYDDRTSSAVKTVLIEIGQILGSFKGKFAIIGGAVPWLLLGDTPDMPHVGTIDIDLALDAEALGDGEYATLVGAMQAHGYAQREASRRFQLVRSAPTADGQTIDIVVDFLMPRMAKIEKNKPPLIEDFAVLRADGADLALLFPECISLSGRMPRGGTNRVDIAVASIPALLAMKGHAINNRHKQKDAYDIYYCVRNYPEGLEALADACKPLMAHESGATGYAYIAAKFETVDDYGPTSVRNFVEDTAVLGDRTPDQWQQDAYGQVHAWLEFMCLDKIQASG
jgi:hypothetical protein